MINIALTDYIQRLLRKKVDNGEFPNEEAVVEEALKCFLIQEPSQGRRQTSSPTEILEERLPGPFIEDQTGSSVLKCEAWDFSLFCRSQSFC